MKNIFTVPSFGYVFKIVLIHELNTSLLFSVIEADIPLQTQYSAIANVSFSSHFRPIML